MPHFVTQRSLYEVRERPSKTYSWKAFMTSNLVVELPWQALMAVFMFFCFYYPVALYRNAEPTDAVAERGALFFLFVLQFMLFSRSLVSLQVHQPMLTVLSASTFAHMVIAGIADAETGGNIANLMFSLCLIFCGVIASPQSLPGFWIFMYRVSPFTYLVDGMLSTGIANQQVTCADNEFVTIQPTSSQTCRQYMATWIAKAGGYLQNPDATSDCSFCTLNDTNTFLTAVSSSYANRWRNFGIMWGFIVFNLFMAVFLYWLIRVPKESKKKNKGEKAV